jgi:hypothetical protein
MAGRIALHVLLAESRRMCKTIVTLKIDTRLLRKIKSLVARRGISFSALTTALFEEKLNKKLEYEQAKRRAVARMREGLDLGFQPVSSRDELHER